MSLSARHQALLSEYKGNLFEFLVGHALSRKLCFEIPFLKNLSPEFQQMLKVQEGFIREYYNYLLTDLPILAESLAQEIITSQAINKDQIEDIVIVGKAALASQNDEFAEADLIVKANNKYYPISVKLSKAHAFVNTKSAGLKSFLSKYFHDCDPKSIHTTQEAFNERVDFILNEFGMELCSYCDIEYEGDFGNWIMAGKTSLSGELGDGEREIYKKMLYALNKEIYQSLKSLYDLNPSVFSRAARKLIGFGDESIIQATSYYAFKDESYKFQRNLVENFSALKTGDGIFSFGELKTNAANFDLSLNDRILQIRVKAMNKFTSKSFKINCSVKVD